MGKQNDAMELSVWTTGAGIVIGTNIDIGGVLSGPAPTTVSIYSGTTLLFAHSGAGEMFATPFSTTGPITGTSSGGSFAVIFRKRNV